MDPDRWAAAINPTASGNRSRANLTAEERATILRLYQEDLRLIEIRDAVGRSLGTVKTAIRGLRDAGLVGYRYVGYLSA